MSNSATLTTTMFRYLDGLTTAAEREGFDVDLVLVDLPYESVIWEVILDVMPISDEDVESSQVTLHLSTVDSSGWDADIFDIEFEHADDDVLRPCTRLWGRTPSACLTTMPISPAASTTA